MNLTFSLQKTSSKDSRGEQIPRIHSAGMKHPLLSEMACECVFVSVSQCTLFRSVCFDLFFLSAFSFQSITNAFFKRSLYKALLCPVLWSQTDLLMFQSTNHCSSVRVYECNIFVCDIESFSCSSHCHICTLREAQIVLSLYLSSECFCQ